MPTLVRFSCSSITIRIPFMKSIFYRNPSTSSGVFMQSVSPSVPSLPLSVECLVTIHVHWGNEENSSTGDGYLFIIHMVCIVIWISSDLLHPPTEYTDWVDGDKSILSIGYKCEWTGGEGQHGCGFWDGDRVVEWMVCLYTALGNTSNRRFNTNNKAPILQTEEIIISSGSLCPYPTPSPFSTITSLTVDIQHFHVLGLTVPRYLVARYV